MPLKSITPKNITPPLEQQLFELFICGYSYSEIERVMQNHNYAISKSTLTRINKKYRWDEKKKEEIRSAAFNMRQERQNSILRYQKSNNLVLNMIASKIRREAEAYIAQVASFDNGETVEIPIPPAWLSCTAKDLKVLTEVSGMVECLIKRIDEGLEDSPSDLTQEQIEGILNVLAADKYPKVEDKVLPVANIDNNEVVDFDLPSSNETVPLHVESSDKEHKTTDLIKKRRSFSEL